MDIFNYEGKEYKRNGNCWVDDMYCKLPEAMQKKLNYAYAKSLEPIIKTWSYDKLVAEADKYKESSSYELAIKLYETALEKCTIGDAKYIFPRITSCYRRFKQPQKAIELYNRLRSKSNEDNYSVALLTSVAAAYADIDDYDTARKFADKAYAKPGGKDSLELQSVYGRINKECDK